MIPRIPSVLLLGAAALAACRGEPRPTATPLARPVRVAPVAQAPAGAAITAAATLGARDEIPLGFKVGGVVARVLVREGERVKAGQLLATLDLQEIDAGLAQVRSALDKAERDAARAERLFSDSVVSRAQRDDAQTGLEVARAQYQAVAVDRRYAVITAPAAGTVLRRQAEPGQVIGSGAPVLMVTSASSGVVARAALADRDIIRVRQGDSATFTAAALPGRRFTGRVVEVGAAPVRGTGAYEVVVLLDGVAGLPTGLVGQVEIAPGLGGVVPVVPVEALVEADGDSGVVFTLAPDSATALRRSVTIARVNGTQVVLAGGIGGARLVVTDGAAYLNDGDAVRVVP